MRRLTGLSHSTSVHMCALTDVLKHSFFKWKEKGKREHNRGSLYCHQLRACSYGGEPASLPGWSSLPRSHVIPNSNTKFDFCSYEQAGWPENFPI